MSTPSSARSGWSVYDLAPSGAAGKSSGGGMGISSYDSLLEWRAAWRREPESTERPWAEFSGYPRHLRGYTRATRPTHDTGPTIIAVLNDGPLAGREVDAAVVEGRPPKTV